MKRLLIIALLGAMLVGCTCPPQRIKDSFVKADIALDIVAPKWHEACMAYSEAYAEAGKTAEAAEWKMYADSALSARELVKDWREWAETGDE
jgi:hypothetical protein